MDTSIILNTGLTFSSMNNKNLFKSIKEDKHPITMSTNLGTRKLTPSGKIYGHPHKVWYDPQSIENIFSFAELASTHRVTYDSDKADAFNVTLQGHMMVT